MSMDRKSEFVERIEELEETRQEVRKKQRVEEVKVGKAKKEAQKIIGKVSESSSSKLPSIESAPKQRLKLLELNLDFKIKKEQLIPANFYCSKHPSV